MAGVKLLSDSNIFKNAIAQLKVDVQDDINQGVSEGIDNKFENLPNESEGDPKPTSGLYLSGDGVVKVA